MILVALGCHKNSIIYNTIHWFVNILIAAVNFPPSLCVRVSAMPKSLFYYQCNSVAAVAHRAQEVMATWQVHPHMALDHCPGAPTQPFSVASAFFMSTSSLMSTTTSPLAAVVATLPLEVEERIIDKLHYHIYALQNCALTCRRWQPRTRYHLFAAIRVRKKDELFSLYTLLSQSPHLLPLVRSLTFRAKLFHESVDIDDREPAFLFQMVPVPLLTSLPNLVCWKFSGRIKRIPGPTWRPGPVFVQNDTYIYTYTWAPAYHRTALATIRRLATTIQELHLIKMSFVTPVDCTRLVSSMPALRKLRCEDVRFKMRQDPEVVDTCIDRLAPNLHVESLTVCNPTSLCIMDTLKLTTFCSS